MHSNATYRLDGADYTYDELIAALDAEAATLPPEQWCGGWDAAGYISEALLTGSIQRVDYEDIATDAPH